MNRALGNGFACVLVVALLGGLLSPAGLSVGAGYIEVSTPGSGEVLYAGTYYDIEFEVHAPGVDEIDVDLFQGAEYFADGGMTFDGYGYVRWFVPSYASGDDFQIKMSSNIDPDVCGYSAPFSIRPMTEAADEYEPDDTPSSGTTVSSDATQGHTLVGEDVDWFTIEVAQTTLVEISADGGTFDLLGIGIFDEGMDPVYEGTVMLLGGELDFDFEEGPIALCLEAGTYHMNVTEAYSYESGIVEYALEFRFIVPSCLLEEIPAFTEGEERGTVSEGSPGTAYGEMLDMMIELFGEGNYTSVCDVTSDTASAGWTRIAEVGPESTRIEAESASSFVFDGSLEVSGPFPAPGYYPDIENDSEMDLIDSTTSGSLAIESHMYVGVEVVLRNTDMAVLYLGIEAEMVFDMSLVIDDYPSVESEYGDYNYMTYDATVEYVDYDVSVSFDVSMDLQLAFPYGYPMLMRLPMCNGSSWAGETFATYSVNYSGVIDAQGLPDGYDDLLDYYDMDFPIVLEELDEANPGFASGNTTVQYGGRCVGARPGESVDGSSAIYLIEPEFMGMSLGTAIEYDPADPMSMAMNATSAVSDYSSMGYPFNMTDFAIPEPDVETRSVSAEDAEAEIASLCDELAEQRNPEEMEESVIPCLPAFGSVAILPLAVVASSLGWFRRRRR